MIEKIYQDPKTIQKYRSTFLSLHINSHLEDLLEKGYSSHLIRKRLPFLYDFSEYLSGKGLSNLQELKSYIQLYLEERRKKAPGADSNNNSMIREIKSHLNRFLKHLIDCGVIDEAEIISSLAGNYQGLLDDFAIFLKDHKGLSDFCQYYYLHYIKRFLCFKGEKVSRDEDKLELTPRDFYQFLSQDGVRYKRTTVNCICSALRVFCHYLFFIGKLHQDFSPLLERPRIYQAERCIRYLSPHQIAKVLENMDCNNSLGLRNYAILLLLISYGLRGKEVVQLCLDDLDWKGESIWIRRRKCGDTRQLPLITSVGEALIRYLKVRPNYAYRQIFLTTCAPIVPLKDITNICRMAIIKANILIAKPGSHTFRYSFAQGLFRKGYPLKWIADTLGHQDLRTTTGYLNISLYPLREVCQNDAEDLL